MAWFNVWIEIDLLIFNKTQKLRETFTFFLREIQRMLDRTA